MDSISTELQHTIDLLNEGIKLRPEFKQIWLERLRSGKYKQGHETLHDKDDNTYCCLGVLCQVVGPEIDLDWVYDEDGCASMDDYTDIPSDRVMNHVLTREWSHGQLVKLNDVLSTMNDDEQWNFNKIADWDRTEPVRTDR
jgi:hypothetical protein